MIAALRGEFRKLYTVRSTYVIALIALAILAFISYYVNGYKGNDMMLASPFGRLLFSDVIIGHTPILAIFGAIVAALIATHEYRYNTIIHTLTLGRSRSMVLVAKIIVTVFYVVGLVALVSLASIGAVIAGLHMGGHVLPHQDPVFLSYLGRSVIYCEGWGLAALLFGILLRNQVATFAVLLLVPSTLETLLALVIGNKSAYLPFTALGSLLLPPETAGVTSSTTTLLSPLHGTLLFAAYLVGGWIVAWVLFLRRDAN